MDDLAILLRTETIRRLEESRRRIVKCMVLLGDLQVWHRPNANTPTVGNLVLHLCGALDQSICGTLGNAGGGRDRAAEFAAQGGYTVRELAQHLDRSLNNSLRVIENLGPEELIATWTLEGRQESGVAILVHMAEHCSYHTGQVTLYTKWLLDLDTGYNADADKPPEA